MKIIKQIVTIMFLAVFLIPATGIFVIEHYCSHSNESSLYFSGEHQHHDHDIDNSCHEHDKLQSCSHEKESICCDAENDGSSCCNDNSFYLKISEPYTFSVLEIDFSNVVCDISFDFIQQQNLQIKVSENIKYSEAPPLITDVKTHLSKLCILRL